MSHPPETVPALLADQLERCIRCGLCLPACPTYEVFRTEMDAPRGRLALMRAVWDGRARGGAAEEHLDLCLGCLSCETACPSGVEYGSLLHATRERLQENRRGGALRRLALRTLGNRPLLHSVSRLTSLARAVGLIALARTLPLPAIARRMLRLLPPRITRFHPPRASAVRGGGRPTVALFRGCVQDAFLGSVHDSTIRLLERAGYDVELPPRQTCCGAAAHHAGEGDLARDLARRNLEAFAPGRYDAVVSNAGGCGAMLRDYGGLFAPESDERASAAGFAASVRDLSEVLAEAPSDLPSGELRCSVVYADSCHLRHAQGVTRQPRDLLRARPGLELRELERPDHCCGSAGLYNLTQGDTADLLLERKLAEIEASGAEIVVTANPGCHLQLLHGVRQTGLETEVVQLAELLDRA